jgi:hypothetical protein
MVSDRKLVEHCSMRMDILYYLGYGIDEELPWHSTLSRTRQLYPPALFESLFNKVFSMCVDKGMVSGHTQTIDSTPVKANASMENLVVKQPATSLEAHLQSVQQENEQETKPAVKGKSIPEEQIITTPDHQLRRLKKHQESKKASGGGLGGKHEKAKLVSNKTHYCPADPDARISVKPGKARKLNYHCSMAVDTAEGIISHVQADFADGRDCQYLPDITSKLQKRLNDNDLKLVDLIADGGYSSGTSYEFLEQQGITGWVPVFGKYKPEIEGFTYNSKLDQFICPAGKIISFRKYDTTVDGGLLKTYRATYKDCQTCPLKSTCLPKTKAKK